MNRFIRLALPLALLGALGGCGDSPAELLGKARASIAADDFAAARLQLASALEERPEDREIMALMAQVQLLLGDADGAEGMLERLERSGARGPGLARMKAALALLRAKPVEALTLLGNDASAEGWRIRAQAQLALGDDAAAARSFENGMAAGTDVGLITAYASYRLASGNVQAAKALYQRLRTVSPHSYEAMVMAGDIAAAEGRGDAAVAAYRQVVKAYPDRVAPMIALANQYDAMGRVDAAMEVVEQAGKIAPEDKQVEALAYQLLSEKGEWEKIRLGLQGRESELEPGTGLQMTYAEALLRLGHAEQARLLFKRAALVLPGNPYSRMMLGEAQLETGDAEGAWETLAPLAASTLARPEVLRSAEKAARAAGAPEADGLRARLEPARLKPVMALTAQGDAALSRQDWAKALEVYSELLKRGEDPEILKRMALAASRLGRASAAIALADRALGTAPDNPDYLYLAGLVRLELGRDLPAARRLLEAAAEGDPRNQTIARDLAKAKAATG